MSGLVALNSTYQTYLKTLFSNIELHFEIGNPRAITSNVRFTEQDLNRQFTPENLAGNNENRCFEALRARELNLKWGPKSAPKTDVVIDIHNTTSNMGATLIILAVDAFHTRLARYIKQQMPHANILVEDEKSIEAHPYLCTIGKIPLMIEVGAQPHGVCRADMSELTLDMLQHILNFCVQVNQHPETVNNMPETFGYRLTGTEYYPETSEGLLREWAIHPKLQDKDFIELRNGDPIFLSQKGDVKTWQGELTYPHFINEAAYHKSNVAFATADKVRL